MVDGKLDIDLRDGEIPHHAITCHIQNLPVVCVLHVHIITAEHITIYIILYQSTVELSRRFPLFRVILRLHIADRLFIITDQPALPVRIPLIGYRGVGKDPKSYQKQQTKENSR